MGCFFFSYSAAAVITKEDGVDDVKYLDKFTVGRQSQVQFEMHLNQNQDIIGVLKLGIFKFFWQIEVCQNNEISQAKSS